MANTAITFKNRPALKRYDLKKYKENIGHTLAKDQMIDTLIGGAIGVLGYNIVPSLLPKATSSYLKMLVGVLTPTAIGAVINSPATIAAAFAQAVYQLFIAHGKVPIAEATNGALDIWQFGDAEVQADIAAIMGGGTAGIGRLSSIYGSQNGSMAMPVSGMASANSVTVRPSLAGVHNFAPQPNLRGTRDVLKNMTTGSDADWYSGIMSEPSDLEVASANDPNFRMTWGKGIKTKKSGWSRPTGWSVRN